MTNKRKIKQIEKEKRERETHRERERERERNRERNRERISDKETIFYNVVCLLSWKYGPSSRNKEHKNKVRKIMY